MTTTDERRPRAQIDNGFRAPGRARIAAGSLRKDRWWTAPLITFGTLVAFIVYSTWAAFVNRDYFIDPYISPFYSPCITTQCAGDTFPKLFTGPDFIAPAIYILVIPAVVLTFIAISTFVRSVSDVSLLNPGAHGFTELIYAFTSAGNNNGSAFAGITANTAWMNTALAVAMLVGRFFLIIPTLALAGALVRKRRVPPSAGTFPTHTPLFVVLVIGVVAIVAALTFLPVLALGPIVELLKI